MALAAHDRVHFYASQDLRHWEKTGEFGPEGNFMEGVGVPRPVPPSQWAERRSGCS